MRVNDKHEEKKSRHWRDMHNLINAAPSNDGTEDVDFWLEVID